MAHGLALRLTWQDPYNPQGTTYNVYRLTGLCPINEPTNTDGFTKLNMTKITVKNYTDRTVVKTNNYCYIVTAVSPKGIQSAPSKDVVITKVELLEE